MERDIGVQEKKGSVANQIANKEKRGRRACEKGKLGAKRAQNSKEGAEGPRTVNCVGQRVVHHRGCGAKEERTELIIGGERCT